MINTALHYMKNNVCPVLVFCWSVTADSVFCTPSLFFSHLSCSATSRYMNIFNAPFLHSADLIRSSQCDAPSRCHVTYLIRLVVTKKKKKEKRKEKRACPVVVFRWSNTASVVLYAPSCSSVTGLRRLDVTWKDCPVASCILLIWHGQRNAE